MAGVDDIQILQAVRLKGRVRSADIAAILGHEPEEVAGKMGDLTERGLLLEGKTIRLSPEGRERLDQLLADERSGIDGAAMSAAYGHFRDVNAQFKALIVEWQLKDGEPNSHVDPEYDAGVLDRLDGIHENVVPIITAAASQIPRLNSYAEKLSAAREKVAAGETTWFTRPLVDSYHTVWFELHEELMLATGLTRDAEAKAGHAQ
ncbi:MAG: hypothetical protein QOE41_4366 [Mycobacterium sp.]|jgi:hypothetical protein|nr:hypothetical protein [Mycobacterium sp.]MDT5135055.1 hypothetical protein [Mycobacterium sp.]